MDMVNVVGMTRVVRWFTILSLDAPTVAVAWQALFADMAGVRLSWERRFILFAAVWLGYVADRWFDSRRADAALAARHRWYGRRSRLIVVIWLGIFAGSLALSLATLSATDLTSGFVLMAATIAYTGFAQKRRRLKKYGHIKCFFIAALMSSGAALFALNWADLRAELLIAPLLSIPLFLTNCLTIRHWEDDRSVSPRLLRFLVIALTLAAGAIPFVSDILLPSALATILSVVTLCILHIFRERIDSEALRFAADFALLSPLALIPFF